MSGRRRDVDNVAFALEQVGERRTNHVEHAREVDGDDAAPLVEAQLGGVTELQDAGDIRQHVELAVGRDGVVDDLLRGDGVTHVETHAGRAVADLVGGGRRALCVEVGADDGGAVLAESHRRCLSNSRCRAGDEHHPSVETSHRANPSVANLTDCQIWMRRRLPARSRSSPEAVPASAGRPAIQLGAAGVRP